MERRVTHARTSGAAEIRSSYHFSLRNASPPRTGLRAARIRQGVTAGLTWIGGAAQLPVPVERMRGRSVARRQRQVRESLPIRHRRIAPPPRLRFLNPEKGLDAAESLAVHHVLETVPRPLHP